MSRFWAGMLAIVISILMTPISALIFMWGWSLFAPTFNLPALGFFESLGIALVARIIFPASVVGAWRD